MLDNKSNNKSTPLGTNMNEIWRKDESISLLRLSKTRVIYLVYSQFFCGGFGGFF